MTKDRGARLKEWFWKSVQTVNATYNVPVCGTAILAVDHGLEARATRWHDAWPRDTDSPPAYPDEFGWGDKGTTDEMKHFCINRHSAFVNFLFMDWSTRPVGLKELWTLKWHRAFNTAGPWTKAGGVAPADWPDWMRGFKDY